MAVKSPITEGQIFNRLAVVKETEKHKYPSGKTRRVFECLCECGNIVKVKINDLISGNTKSCGCLQKEVVTNRNLNSSGLDTGVVYGRLKPLRFSSLKVVNGKSRAYWEFICSCGKQITVCANSVVSGNTKSCGCLKKEVWKLENTIHGKSEEPIYEIYMGIIKRCHNSKSESYNHYGGRGITVCDRWMEPDGRGFINFLEDVGERPEGFSIDRVDVNGNYEPDNCRWATSSVQGFNRRQDLNKTTGVTGVCEIKYKGEVVGYRARCNYLGRMLEERFLYSKYGEDCFMRAVEARAKMVRDINDEIKENPLN